MKGRPHMKQCGKFILFANIIGLFLVGMATASFAQSLTLTCDPTEATANSIWNFTAVWTDPEGMWPTGVISTPYTYDYSQTEGSTDYNPTLVQYVQF